MLRLLAVTALTVSTTLAFAQDTLPGDRIYDLHSVAQGSCPALTWHIVVQQDGVLTGTIAWDHEVAQVAGTIVPLVQIERDGKSNARTVSKPNARTFSMSATGTDGPLDRIADISGTISPNGWLSANIQGTRMACQNVKAD